MRISREDLYKEVWSELATTLARRYDVSSSYLARVCEGLNVPHPPRGYWARRAAGEKMPVPPLPPAGPGDPLAWEKGVAVLERLPPLELPPQQPRAAGKATPPRRPAHHPLVTAWRGFLEEASPTESGYMVTRKKNVLDAFVTKGMIRGAAEALNAILIELEMRGHRVQLADEHAQRPPVDVALREIKDSYMRRTNDWQPGRATIAYMSSGARIGLTFFELTEHVRVRRKGADRYVRISELAPTRRYAPQAPDEEDETRDMPAGRFVFRAFSPLYDTEWRQEWIEKTAGEFVTIANAIADALEEAAPVILKQAEDAAQRRREEQARWKAQERREKAREHTKAVQQARQAAKDELRSIVKAWNDAFAVEAFFAELSRRAKTIGGDERAELERRIAAARDLMGGKDALERFLQWTIPDDAQPDDVEDEDDDVDDDDD